MADGKGSEKEKDSQIANGDSQGNGQTAPGNTCSGTDKNIVAAIDFGSTYCGYAYTFRTEYEKSTGARQIFSNRWSDSGSLLSAKAPTTALFDSEYNFHSFGYEAEQKYAELIDRKQHNEWHCFRRFKMKLHDKMTLKRELEIPDEAGRLFPAKKVFTDSIRYLREKLVEEIENRNPMKIKLKKVIHWVLTVPAIWTEPSKQFMREAATDAGIPSEDLRIALEPEAAAVYCRSLPLDTLTDSQDQEVTGAFRPGGSYMIIDLGGGTVDMAVHEVSKDGRLIEIWKASGGPWGGTSVDKTFYDFVVKMFGKEFIEQFRITRAKEWMKLSMEFETQKRKLKFDTNYNIKVELPPRLIAESNLEVKDLTSFNKLSIENDDFKNFFQPSTEDIVAHIRSILAEVGKVDLILLVGGFATSGYVNRVIKDAFPDKRVVVPLQAEVAVMYGAVLFGFEPLVISSRVCRHTYGIRVTEDFKEGYHRTEYMAIIDGEPKCKNIFSGIVKEGETVGLTETRNKTYTSTHRDESRRYISIEFAVFASKSVCPKYTTEEPCVRLGCITIEPPADGWPPKVNYNVDMYFGQTEFNITVKNDANGLEYSSSFDFLG
ncbi:heat shock 70 kDa protein 12A-like [Pecten maximus]|uniref:heat shock 70 kDa protein 12A-like n=1 Tax=Pecten maximus TaxID=6579 RepID=UPI001458F539|nr:heat shock 70 kDa protein 12A-like [Pecten maximus]